LIDRNIELMRYKYFGDDLLMLELVNAQSAQTSQTKAPAPVSSKEPVNKTKEKTHADSIAAASNELTALYHAICDYCDSLGDEVQRKELKVYTAFKRIKNFVSVIVYPQKDQRVHLYLKVDPSTVALEEGFAHDVTNKGHWGTGNLEVVVRAMADLDKAKALIEKSYLDN
jgi:predicted transport protein